MKKAIAIILLILFVPIFLMVTFYFSTTQTLLDAKTMTDKFAQSNIYMIITNEVLPNIADMMTSQESIQDTDTNTEQATEALKESISENIDADWLQTEFTKAYEKITDYLKNNDSSKEIVIDLSPLSESLSVTNLTQNMLTDEFIQSQFDSMPKCSTEINTDCIPENTSYEEFKSEIEKEVEQINSEEQTDGNEDFIPATINLYESFDVKDDSSPNFGQNMLDIGSNIIKNINYAGYILIGILAFIILVVVLMFRQDPYFMTKSLGTTFLVTSIIMIILSSLGYFTVPAINTLIPLEAAGLSSLGLVIIPIISAIIGSIVTKIIIAGIILLAISIILLVYSKKFKSQKTQKNNA